MAENKLYPFTGKWRLLTVAVISVLTGMAQGTYKRIDGIVAAIPKQQERSIESLAKYIADNSQTDLEKARGAYYWVSNNVRYDVRKYARDKPSNFEPEKVFRKRKAVCAGYANLYMELCRQMNLPCEMVSGYSKGFGYKRGRPLNESDHVWNAVKADTAWRLLDVTWGAGYIKKIGIFTVYRKRYNDRYFLVKSEDFLLDHLPEVPMWQLLEHPIPLKSFSMDEGKVYDEIKRKKSPYYKYTDSIASFRSKDSITMALDFGKMAIRFNAHNPIPLAYGMLKTVEENIQQKNYNTGVNISVVDSMIYFTDNAIKLFKKAKSASKAVKERLEGNISMAHNILAQLHSIRSSYYEAQLLMQNEFTFDSLKYVSDQIAKSMVLVIRFHKTDHHKRLLKSSEERFCTASLNLHNNFSDLEQKETDLKKKKRVKKQAHQVLLLAKKNLSYQSDCLKSLYAIKE